MCKVCFSTIDVYGNMSDSNLDSISINGNKPKRSGNKTNDDSIFEIDEYINATLNSSYDKLEGSTTEYGDQTNLSIYDDDYIERPCYGQPDYCNMTRREYLDMLNDYIFPQPYEWVLIATHAIVFVIGLIGNALVCIAVYRNHSMRTVTNYFIVNLAMADFMVILICLPPTVLWDVTETWFFGTAMCRIVLYFQVSGFIFV